MGWGKKEGKNSFSVPHAVFKYITKFPTFDFIALDD
jgi:hypothetical protein